MAGLAGAGLAAAQYSALWSRFLIVRSHSHDFPISSKGGSQQSVKKKLHLRNLEEYEDSGATL